MSAGKTQKITIESFTNESSIHGIRFIGDSKNHKMIRIFWTISFISSIIGFIFYANSVYAKWKHNPDIALKTNWKSITDIPFPAITICFPFFAKNGTSKVENFLDVRNSSLTNSLSEDEQSIAAAAAQACNLYVASRSARFLPKSSSNKFIEHLIATAPTVNEAFEVCFFDRIQIDCEKVLNRILFDTGFCYTYNVQGYDTIFRRDFISKDFNSFRRKKIAKTLFGMKSNETVDDDKPEKLDWTIFNGYNSNSYEVFPVRASKSGAITFYPKVNDSDIPNLCLRYGKGFRLFLHSPNEIGTFPLNEFYIPFNQERHITIGAKYIRYSDDLKIYPPEKRQCYFEGERKLKFFNSYSKNHCLLECLTEFTLKECDCVKFSMPRSEETPICNLSKISCYINAYNRWPLADAQNAKTLMPCDCFQTCSDINYDVKLDRVSEFQPKIRTIQKNANYAEIMIKFNDILMEEKGNFVGYKLQNFIADTGGLLGLFMGCSILSIVELVYYFIKGLYGKYRRYKAKLRKIAFFTKSNQSKMESNLQNSDWNSMDDLDLLETLNRNNHIYILKHPLYQRTFTIQRF